TLSAEENNIRYCENTTVKTNYASPANVKHRFQPKHIQYLPTKVCRLSGQRPVFFHSCPNKYIKFYNSSDNK
ncbi:hypothetical protein C362_06861, partial [Cryptococcus neoformans Bt1]